MSKVGARQTSLGREFPRREGLSLVPTNLDLANAITQGRCSPERPSRKHVALDCRMQDRPYVVQDRQKKVLHELHGLWHCDGS